MTVCQCLLVKPLLGKPLLIPTLPIGQSPRSLEAFFISIKVTSIKSAENHKLVFQVGALTQISFPVFSLLGTCNKSNLPISEAGFLRTSVVWQCLHWVMKLILFFWSNFFLIASDAWPYRNLGWNSIQDYVVIFGKHFSWNISPSENQQLFYNLSLQLPPSSSMNGKRQIHVVLLIFSQRKYFTRQVFCLDG